ncbi:MAG TPA: DNA mismatch repair protein MutS [Thermoanaerobaculia bacterium]|nr:DNA mismatch repair protein MutS [Thermoanaerobaculia bacterium]
MLRQYLEVKAEHPDAIVLYRMGDFYEMFFDDARQAAPILEVQLTARNRGSENEAPMCGVPHLALDTYLAKLLAAGLRVAICDQVEDPAQAKGLVKREVTRVVTPGTVSDPGLLDGKEENLLAGLTWDGDKAGAGAFLDLSTGSFFVRRWASTEEGVDDLALLRPREVLFHSDRGEEGFPAAIREWAERECPCRTPLAGDRLFDPHRAEDLLLRQFGVGTLRGYGLVEGELAVRAAAAALAYAQETQKSALSHVRGIAVREARDRLILDAATLANLEVFRPQRLDLGMGAAAARRRTTLLSVLDRTVTPPGGRTIREWVRRPLVDPAAIAERHRAVGELAADNPRRERLRDRLSRVGDPERLLARAVLGTLSPREAGALRDGLAEVPAILAELSEALTPVPSPAPPSTPTPGEGRPHTPESKSPPLPGRVCSGERERGQGGEGLLAAIASTDPLLALHAELARTLEEAPAHTLQEGGVIAAGVDPELDRIRSLGRDSKRHILALEARERERTGISSLKIRFNKVFGYYLEITKANQQRVPADYIRKQTLVNAERYVTPEIKELEDQILSAEERQAALEEKHFRELTAKIAVEAPGLTALAAALGSLDALASFAEAAARHRYVRPVMSPAGGRICIREGRHPVVELASRDAFVPNDAELDERAGIVLLTGPNMGGKSTYLRQVALIVLMAQAGSFVPADEAEIGVVDRIFTRVGASDDLARGESTFMVEMIETANILRHATEHSLVILDEVGRGTATFDGLSLAWAIVEYLHEHRTPKTLFATHYHELTELASLLPRVVNRTMAVREWDERIVFLRRVVPGAADKSYGLHVARLAGLPAQVVERAGEVLANLEAYEYDPTGKPRLARRAGGEEEEAGGDPPSQLTLFAPPEQVVAGILKDVDIERLTPIAALNLLHSLKSRLG